MFAFANGQAGQPQTNDKKSDPLGVLYMLCLIHSTCIIVFLRTCFGREAVGLRGVFALVLLLVCCGPEPLMSWWVAAFLAAVVVQRIITLRAISKGAVIHTYYAGTPLFMKIPFVKQERDAMILEMILCFFLGALLLAVSQFMAGFMWLGTVTLLIRAGIDEFYFQRRLDKIRDARIEGRWLSDRLR